MWQHVEPIFAGSLGGQVQGGTGAGSSGVKYSTIHVLSMLPPQIVGQPVEHDLLLVLFNRLCNDLLRQHDEHVVSYEGLYTGP